MTKKLEFKIKRIKNIYPFLKYFIFQVLASLLVSPLTYFLYTSNGFVPKFSMLFPTPVYTCTCSIGACDDHFNSHIQFGCNFEIFSLLISIGILWVGFSFYKRKETLTLQKSQFITHKLILITAIQWGIIWLLLWLMLALGNALIGSIAPR